MYYATDTHAFLWYLMESKKLSKKAEECFDTADRGNATIIIPAIVLMECIDVIDKKKVEVDFESITSKLNEASNFILAEINWNLIMEINRTKGLKDLHDRSIIATANIFDAKLISKDKIVKNYYPKTIW
jgi:PIN domain nuclease of toxin-antitoxin system